jgi:hypothetical protein
MAPSAICEHAVRGRSADDLGDQRAHEGAILGGREGFREQIAPQIARLECAEQRLGGYDVVLDSNPAA